MRGWEEVRKELRLLGITPTASYVGALQTNATGGRNHVWAYAGQLTLGLSSDLEELAKLRGLSAYVSFSWGTGSNLADTIQSSVLPSTLYAPSYYLGEMYLQESLAEKKVTIMAGRLAASDSFGALPAFTNYVTYAINPNPASLTSNDDTFSGPPPGSQWGAQVSYLISPKVQVEAGAFNTNLHSAYGENHGADFALQEGNKGMLALGQVDFLRNQRVMSTGMPGQFSAGFLRNNNSFPRLSDPMQHTNGYRAAYAMAQQMVYRPGGPGTTRGATVWGVWSSNFQDAVSLIPLFWAGGVSYEGLIPSRKEDVFSAAMIRAETSRFVSSVQTERVLELNYQWNHSRFFTIMPHLQYFWQREGTQKRNATVIGLQLALTL